MPHRPNIFTGPELLCLRFRFDRRLLGLMSGCVYHSVLEMMREVASEPEAVPGVVTSA